MNKVDSLIQMLAKAPDTQIDKTQVVKLQAIVGKSPKEQADVLKEVLDVCAHGGLASDFAMVAMDSAWKQALAAARKP
jgi:hypothetical protein